MKNLLVTLSLLLCCVSRAQLTNIATGQNISQGTNISNVVVAGGGGGGGGGDITTGLLAWFKCDEGSGTVYLDSSGNGVDATVYGSAGWTNSAKIGSYAASFPGASGSGAAFAQVSYPPPGDFTVAAWVYLNNYHGTAFQNFVTQGAGAGIWFVSGKVDYYYGGSHQSTTVIPLNTWTHVMVVGQGSTGTVQIYINNTLDASSWTGLGIASMNCFGADNGNGGEQLDGFEDDIRIYGRAFTNSTDRTTLYNYRYP